MHLTGLSIPILLSVVLATDGVPADRDLMPGRCTLQGKCIIGRHRGQKQGQSGQRAWENQEVPCVVTGESKCYRKTKQGTKGRKDGRCWTYRFEPGEQGEPAICGGPTLTEATAKRILQELEEEKKKKGTGDAGGQGPSADSGPAGKDGAAAAKQSSPSNDAANVAKDASAPPPPGEKSTGKASSPAPSKLDSPTPGVPRSPPPASPGLGFAAGSDLEMEHVSHFEDAMAAGDYV